MCLQDAMAIVRKFGSPHLFITMTCNPNWPEITAELLPRQSANDRAELVCRVFKLKLDVFFEVMTKKHVLGEVQVCVCTLPVVACRLHGSAHRCS